MSNDYLVKDTVTRSIGSHTAAELVRQKKPLHLMVYGKKTEDAPNADEYYKLACGHCHHVDYPGFAKALDQDVRVMVCNHCKKPINEYWYLRQKPICDWYIVPMGTWAFDDKDRITIKQISNVYNVFKDRYIIRKLTQRIVINVRTGHTYMCEPWLNRKPFKPMWTAGKVVNITYTDFHRHDFNSGGYKNSYFDPEFDRELLDKIIQMAIDKMDALGIKHISDPEIRDFNDIKFFVRMPFLSPIATDNLVHCTYDFSRRAQDRTKIIRKVKNTSSFKDLAKVVFPKFPKWINRLVTKYPNNIGHLYLLSMLFKDPNNLEKCLQHMNLEVFLGGHDFDMVGRMNDIKKWIRTWMPHFMTETQFVNKLCSKHTRYDGRIISRTPSYDILRSTLEFMVRMKLERIPEFEQLYIERRERWRQPGRIDIYITYEAKRNYFSFGSNELPKGFVFNPNRRVNIHGHFKEIHDRLDEQLRVICNAEESEFNQQDDELPFGPANYQCSKAPNQEIPYSEREQSWAGEYADGYYFVNAPDTDYLQGISDQMNHCVWSYGDRAVCKQVTIVTLEKDGDYKVCLELMPIGKEGKAYKIVQAKEKNNRFATTEHAEIIADWAKENGIYINTSDMSALYRMPEPEPVDKSIVVTEINLATYRQILPSMSNQEVAATIEELTGVQVRIPEPMPFDDDSEPWFENDRVAIQVEPVDNPFADDGDNIPF